jgi:hypothetical protein
MKAHSIANSLLFDTDEQKMNSNYESFNELPVYWEEPLYKLECKSMIDRLVIDHENKVIKLIDLKTASSIKDLKDKIREFNYHRQLTFYWYAIHWYFKNKGFDISGYEKETKIIFIKKRNPVEIKVVEVHHTILNEGDLDLRPILKELDWHYTNDKWDHDRLYYDNKCQTII